MLYVLYFNEWGWEEDEEQSGNILGVYNKESFAKNDLEKAKEANHHGDYSIRKVEINQFYPYGAY